MLAVSCVKGQKCTFTIRVSRDISWKGVTVFTQTVQNFLQYLVAHQRISASFAATVFKSCVDQRISGIHQIIKYIHQAGQLAFSSDEEGSAEEVMDGLCSAGAHNLSLVIAGKYRIIRVLGKGGMGVVFLVRHVKLGKLYALKMLQPSFASDVDAIARFRREARVMGSIDHPHVLGAVDFDDGACPYIVMPLVKGMDLADHYEQEKDRRDWRYWLQIMKQVADGVAAMHSFGAGIIHRDLKPANVMITDDEQVLVVDMGLVKIVGQADPMGSKGIIVSAELTNAGETMGTPVWMSPEQASGFDITPSSDVYTLGKMIFFLITGIKLHEASALQAVMVNVAGHTQGLPKELSDAPRSGHIANPMYLGFVRKILERCLLAVPSRRYQNASELAQELASALVNIEVEQAKLAETAARARAEVEAAAQAQAEAEQEAARNRRLLLAASSIALVILILATGLVYSYGQQAAAEAKATMALRAQAREQQKSQELAEEAARKERLLRLEQQQQVEIKQRQIQINEIMQQASSFQQEQQWKKAVELYKRVLELDNNFVLARENLAECWFNLLDSESFEEYYRLFDQVDSKDEDKKYRYLFLGIFMHLDLAYGNPTYQALLEKRMDQIKDYPRYAKPLEVFILYFRYGEAVRKMNEAKQQGNISLSNDFAFEATALLSEVQQKIPEIDPSLRDDWLVLYIRAYVCGVKPRPDHANEDRLKAVHLLTQSICKRPNLVIGYMLRAVIQDELGQYAPALRDYLRVISITPGWSVACIRVSEALLREANNQVYGDVRITFADQVIEILDHTKWWGSSSDNYRDYGFTIQINCAKAAAIKVAVYSAKGMDGEAEQAKEQGREFLRKASEHSNLTPQQRLQLQSAINKGWFR